MTAWSRDLAFAHNVKMRVMLDGKAVADAEGDTHDGAALSMHWVSGRGGSLEPTV